MAKLQSYDNNQKTKKVEAKSMASGIACSEKGCKGEMMIVLPEKNHPELPLKRARCSKCGWLGWV